MQCTTLAKPLDLFINTGIDEIVEIAIDVFHGQGIRVNELFGNEEMELDRQVHE